MAQLARVKQLHERRAPLTKADDFVILRRAKREFVAEMRTHAFRRLPDHPAWDEEHVTFEDRGPHDARAQARAQEVVAAVVGSTGQWFKVDGHRRSRLWQGGVLPRPETVTVRVIEVPEVEDLDALREAPMPPLPEAYEHRPPELYAACGIALYSFRLREGHIIEALRLACRGMPVNRFQRDEDDFVALDAVAAFRDELVRIDLEVMPSNQRFPSALLAAALMSTALYPAATQFWLAYAGALGHEQAGLGKDPIAALDARVKQAQSEENGHRLRNRQHQHDLLAAALRCFELWRETREGADRWVDNGVEPADVSRWIKAVAKSKPDAPKGLITPEKP